MVAFDPTALRWSSRARRGTVRAADRRPPGGTVAEPVVTEIATGLQFPEGPVWMPDGTVLCVELQAPHRRPRASRRHGRDDRRAGREPERSRDRSRRRGLRLQQRRVGLPRDHGTDHHRRSQQPDDYSGGRIERVDLDTGDGDRPLHRVRRQPADGPERPRVRRPGRDVVHRPRQDPGPGARPRRRVLRGARRLVDHRGDLPARVAERHRACRPRATGSTWPRPTPAACYWWPVEGPGTVGKPSPVGHGGLLLAGLPGMQLLDSLGGRLRRQRRRRHARRTAGSR